jgi:hypothetical protein
MPLELFNKLAPSKVSAEIQHTEPSEPVKELQVQEQLDRIESALLHPWHTLEMIEKYVERQDKFLDMLVKDNLIKRQVHDDFALLGLTLNYALKYHRHLFVYLYTATPFTLAVSNGYSQTVPANYWTLVNFPEGVYLTVSGGSDTTPILCQFRACDVPLEPGIQQVTLTGTNTITGTVTETNSAAILADTADIETNTGNIPPLGQALMAASTPVVIASNQSPFTVIPQGASTTFVAAGTVANTVIKGTPGTLFAVFASTTAAGAGQIFDNATTNAGTPVGIAPSAIGFETGAAPPTGRTCVNGITLAGSATNPALTLFWR